MTKKTMRTLIKMFLGLGLVVILFIRGLQTDFIIIRSPQITQYDILPRYDADERPFYQPMRSSSFEEISTFKDIVIGSPYKDETPLILINETIFIGGSIENDTDFNGTNVSLVSANVYTGEIYWQKSVGNNIFVTDFERIYIEAEKESFSEARLVAFDVFSGDVVWETSFDWKYAVGIESLLLVDSQVVAHTFNKGFGAFYILNKETGHIQQFVKEKSYRTLPPEYLKANLTYEDLILETSGEGDHDTLTAIRKNDGSIAWQIKQPIISNITLGGSVIYFFTKDAQLIAIDTQTGEIIGVLAFSPNLSDDFTYANTPIVVAAHEDIVAVYFGKSNQISIFRLRKID